MRWVAAALQMRRSNSTLSSCRRSQSSAVVLANRAISCSNYLTMGRASCSHYLPLCSPSSPRARQRRVVLTIRANGFRACEQRPAVLNNQRFWRCRIWRGQSRPFLPPDRSQNRSRLLRFETPASRRLLRRQGRATALHAAPADIFMHVQSVLLIGT